MIHLDTGFLIRALVRETTEDAAMRGWLRSGEDLGISAVGWTEFLCGPLSPEEVELTSQVVPRRVPLGEEEAALAAALFNAAGRRRGSLADCMIAATAIRAEASLATTNSKDFSRFESSGLSIVAIS